MSSKLLGGILLIVGTTIGGGMLALPVVTAQGGLIGSLLLLVASWAVMTFSALLILEANFWFPPNSNIIMMAKKTLGPIGEIVAWISYLVLFYCLLAAYIAGGSDIFHGLMLAAHIPTSSLLDAVLFTSILGSIVYLGVHSIDHVNRWLMLLKLGAFVLLVIFILPRVQMSRLSSIHVRALIPEITVVMTSFGFANIIPTLRVYFNNDLRSLRKVILIGSVIPLCAYIIWMAAILGGIPFEGAYGMHSIINSPHSTLALTQALIYHSQNSSVTTLTRVFTSVCMVTSFLGVCLCLVDFLSDGFSMAKTGWRKIFLHALTLLPPLLIALIYPTVFIMGLSYAGVTLSILLLVLPVLIVYRGRYQLALKGPYEVIGGKIPLCIVFVTAIIVIAQGLFFH